MGGWRLPGAADELAVEEPLEMRVGDETVGITMRTPGHDLELTRRVPGYGRPSTGRSTLPCANRISPNRVTAAPAASQHRSCCAADACNVTGLFRRAAAFAVRPASRMSTELRARRRAISRSPASCRSYAWPRKRLEGAQPGFVADGGVHAAAILAIRQVSRSLSGKTSDGIMLWTRRSGTLSAETASVIETRASRERASIV